MQSPPGDPNDADYAQWHKTFEKQLRASARRTGLATSKHSSAVCFLLRLNPLKPRVFEGDSDSGAEQEDAPQMFGEPDPIVWLAACQILTS
jgi:hypothetical protein